MPLNLEEILFFSSFIFIRSLIFLISSTNVTQLQKPKNEFLLFINTIFSEFYNVTLMKYLCNENIIEV